MNQNLIKTPAIFALDILLIICSWLGAYFALFNSIFEVKNELLVHLPIVIVVKLMTFHFFKVYRIIWRFTGTIDLINIVKGNLVATFILFIYSLFQIQLTLNLIILDGLISVFLLGGFRAAIRQLALEIHDSQSSPLPLKRAIVIGAGAAGEKMIREIRSSRQFSFSIAGFLDDDQLKRGKRIHGYPVFGGIDLLDQVKEKFRLDTAIVAIPSATGDEFRRIFEACKKNLLPILSVPSLEAITKGKGSMINFRRVTYDDLLGRDPVELETDRIEEHISGKNILVTGAGGSIGSELCKQICEFNPKTLILCDNSENNLFTIDLSLKKEFVDQKLQIILSDVQDFEQIQSIFDQYSPDIVFHTAAYKHVPMMETNPWEAVKNNIQGTRNVLKTAIEKKVSRFVLVSTDKAVRPTNIMGASKRVTEMLALAHAKSCKETDVIIVRFGNVIGSQGSVVPLFQQQIDSGGPLTLTHPEITRYFMTIPEAAQLILQSGTMGSGGEIYILDMGKPIRIADLANDLIRLSGLAPSIDIDIEITGLRPGEKLFEELITSGEGVISTEHDRIMVLRGETFDLHTIDKSIDELIAAAHGYDGEKIREVLQETVEDFTYSKE